MNNVFSAGCVPVGFIGMGGTKSVTGGFAGVVIGGSTGNREGGSCKSTGFVSGVVGVVGNAGNVTTGGSGSFVGSGFAGCGVGRVGTSGNAGTAGSGAAFIGGGAGISAVGSAGNAGAVGVGMVGAGVVAGNGNEGGAGGALAAPAGGTFGASATLTGVSGWRPFVLSSFGHWLAAAARPPIETPKTPAIIFQRDIVMGENSSLRQRNRGNTASIRTRGAAIANSIANLIPCDSSRVCANFPKLELASFHARQRGQLGLTFESREELR
jgi:hypothetical protein